MLPRELEPIAPGVWAWVQQDGTWWVNNAGLIAGDDGDELVDTCATLARTRELLAAIDTARPGARLRWAVNTHAHGDHTHGNCLLPAETTIISHPATRRALVDDIVIEQCPPFWDPVPDWGGAVKRLPELLTASADIVTGQRTVEIRHPGFAAHTDGDLITWLPDAGVLFAGDLVFNGLTPLVFMGSVPGARDALDWLAGFSPDVLVPGHGPVLRASAITAELDRQRRYYDFVASIGEDALRRGSGPLEAASRADLGDFAHWADSERLVMNLHRYLADARGETFEPVAAFADAVAWKGTPLPTTV